MISITVSAQKENIFTMKMSDQLNDLCEGTIQIGQACELLEISKADDSLQFSMGKALLNLADRKDVKEVICKNKDLFQLANQLGFKLNEDYMILLLKGYFSTNCIK